MKKRKFVYILCLLTVLVLNMLYVNYQFFIMLLLVILMPGISWLLFLFSKAGMKLFLLTGEPVMHLNGTQQIRIKTEYGCPMPILYGSLYMRIQYSNTKNSQDMEVPVSAFMEKTDPVDIDICPLHCGPVCVYMERLVLYDLLRLFQVENKYRSYRRFVVLPEIIYAERGKGTVRTEDEDEYDEKISATDNSEVVGLRTFAPGDLVNRIHWKLSTRTDELIVREYGTLVEKKNIILVDLSLEQNTEFRGELDLIYQAAYAVGNLYVENNQDAVFMAWNEQAARLEDLKFSDMESLKDAMIGLMDISCSMNAGIRAETAFRESDRYRNCKAFFITSQDYTSTEYHMIHVGGDDLKLMLDWLAENM
jgi:uncharacterized protein (DUF58 family)